VLDKEDLHQVIAGFHSLILSPWAIVRRDATFSRFETIPACDRQTDRHTTAAYAALA